MISKFDLKQKLLASSIHFAFSFLAIVAFLSVVWFIWFAPPYFELEGATDLLIIMIGVDVVLGPLMTMILYKKGKKGLLFDLGFVVTVQVVALLYGAITFYSERPQYIVFAVDRFEVANASLVEIEKIQYKELKYGLFTKPIMVYAKFPTDLEERNALLFEAMTGGPDLAQRADLYHPIQGYYDEIMLKGISLQTQLKYSRSLTEQLQAILAKHHVQQQDVVFIPLQGRMKIMTLVFNQTTHEVLGILDIHAYRKPKPDTEPKPANPDNSG